MGAGREDLNDQEFCLDHTSNIWHYGRRSGSVFVVGPQSFTAECGWVGSADTFCSREDLHLYPQHTQFCPECKQIEEDTHRASLVDTTSGCLRCGKFLLFGLYCWPCSEEMVEEMEATKEAERIRRRHDLYEGDGSVEEIWKLDVR